MAVMPRSIDNNPSGDKNHEDYTTHRNREIDRKHTTFSSIPIGPIIILEICEWTPVEILLCIAMTQVIPLIKHIDIKFLK